MRMQQVKKITELVAHIIGRKLDYNTYAGDLIQVETPSVQDPLELIRYYLNNQHLVTEQLIADLVRDQLNKNDLHADISSIPKSANWSDYIQKLDQVLAAVRYRREHNFSFDQIMPTQQQLHELQHECLELTEQWYGKGNGNISCFYAYFVAMSQEAYITSFKYDQLEKYISDDGYISLVNVEQRRGYYLRHEEIFYHDFVRQGGHWARGRSEIDATSMSNIFYYKTAQLLFNYRFAQQLVVTALGLENYGQLPYDKRLALWRQLQLNFPDHVAADEHNIFYKFAVYLNLRPGEMFNYFSADLPEANQVTAQMLFDIIKIAGIQSKYLVLLSRSTVDNWPPKRYLTLRWLRKSGELELARVWPNEMPYAPGHGLSLCGDGLLEGWEPYGSISYEWNTPINPKAEKDNFERDIEKIFKEMIMLCPKIKYNSLLPGEQLLSIFQNMIAYSTIRTTEHTHIVGCIIDNYAIYKLPEVSEIAIPKFGARFQLVPVGTDVDAFFLRIFLADLGNDALVDFLIQMNKDFLAHFGGLDKVDCYLQLFSTATGDFAFIYEPHVRLVQLEPNKFLNPDNKLITPRRPQLLHPTAGNLSRVTNEMAAGLDYLRTFFDQTCKLGTHKWISEYLTRYVTSHQ
jgi:hypothetical protein